MAPSRCVRTIPIKFLQGRIYITPAHCTEFTADLPRLGIDPAWKAPHKPRCKTGKFPHGRPETGIELDDAWTHQCYYGSFGHVALEELAQADFPPVAQWLLGKAI